MADGPPYARAMAYAAKTHPTDQDPVAYCAALPTARRREEGARLMALFEEITGERSVMWGPSMIGYGQEEYTSARGTSRGEWFRVGFSPRKAAISLYGLQSAGGAAGPLARLGKHRTGAGCVCVNGLRDVDESVLRELIALGWRSSVPGC